MIGTILSGCRTGEEMRQGAYICGVKGWLRVLGKRVWLFVDGHEAGSGVFAMQGLPLL